MKKLYIIGAGGLGKEILGWLSEIKSTEFIFAGFLNDTMPAFDHFPESDRPHVECPIQGHEIGRDDVFVCAIAATRDREKIVTGMLNRGAQFVSLIHPTAVISKRTKIGIGCVIYPFAYVGTESVIGDFVIVNAHSSVGHNAEIRDFVTLSGHCDITGHVNLGKGSFLGSHASVLPKVSVGEYSVIGAGSVAIRSVKEGATVIGVPGRLL